jgi:NIMA (never in mitosis gene a)-related kinase 1/4/5
MKKVKLGVLNEKERTNALNEVRILASLDDKYVIGYKDAFYDEGYNGFILIPIDQSILCIIMEFADGGDIA